MIRLYQIRALVRRYPFCGGCAALSVLLIIFSVGLWFHVRSLAVLQRKRQVEGEAVQLTLIAGPQLRQELAFVRQINQRIADSLISEENLADNVNYFYKIEEESEARLDDLHAFNAPPPDTDSPYKKIPFGLKVSGTFAQVAAFIHAVETGPRLVSINHFSFRKRAGTTLIVADLNLDLLGKK